MQTKLWQRRQRRLRQRQRRRRRRPNVCNKVHNGVVQELARQMRGGRSERECALRLRCCAVEVEVAAA